MPLNLEKAKLMYKLAVSKRNWGAKYDRLEHFKRFQNLNKIIKELSIIDWIILHKKQNYKAISLNPKYKKDIYPLVIEQLHNAPDNQLGQYAEKFLKVLNKDHQNSFEQILSSRQPYLEKDAHRKRIAKIQKKLWKKLIAM